MDIPALPDEARYILEEHRDEGDAPVWWYRPMNVRERAAFLASASGDARVAEEGTIAISGVRMQQLVTLFAEHLTRVDNLTVGGEPFDAESDRHLDALVGRHTDWAIRLSSAIVNNAHLSEDEQGN